MSTHARWAPTAAAVGVGLLSALQARVNGELSHVLGNGMEAAVYSFGSGWIVLIGMVIAMPSIRAGLRRIPSAIRTGELKWWMVLAGVLGGFYVATQSISVPLVGVAIFTIAVVAGQSANSLLVDRVGLGPAGVQRITARRVTSAVLAVIAVTIAVANRLTAGEIGWVIVLPLLGGIGIAIQQALNGRISIAARNPLSATVLNFTFGTIVLAAGLGIAGGVAGQQVAPLFSGPWWAYFGGIIGIAFIALSAWVVPIIGVLLYVLLSIAGQLSGALLLDLVAPTHGSQVGWNLILGVVLAFVAVAISVLRPGAKLGK